MQGPVRSLWLHYLFVAMAALGCLRASGQGKLPELDYLIRFTGPVDHYQEKRVFEVLSAHEPGLGVWLDVPNQQVKVRTHLVIHRDELQSHWAGDGLVIAYFGLLSPLIRVEQAALSGDDRFPQYIDTGDPTADDAAYQAAKAAWIAAHPEAYQHLEQHPGDE